MVEIVVRMSPGNSILSPLRRSRSHREAIAKNRARVIARRRTIVVRTDGYLMKWQGREGSFPFKNTEGAVFHSVVGRDVLDPTWGDVRVTKFSVSGLRSLELWPGHTIISNEVTD